MCFCLIIDFLIIIFCCTLSFRFCLLSSVIFLSWFQNIKSFLRKKTRTSYWKKHSRKYFFSLFRPYPYQLWVAPRNRLSRFFCSAEEKNVSPPGFENNYALFLYPDNIAIDWIRFFIGIVLIPQLFAMIFSDIPTDWLALGGSLLFFLFSYKIIYIVARRPILDDLWNVSQKNSSIIWPKTEAQNDYFQSVPSRITFNSKEHLAKYNENFSFADHSGNITSRVIRLLFSSIEKIFFWKNIRLKKIHYLYRPVFFNPEGSLQEAVLCTGIASFFAAEEDNSLWNILLFILYSLSHLWVSYLYLLALLLWIFIKGKPFNCQSETVYLVVQIIFWLILSAVSLTRQFSFIQGTLLKSDRRLFSFVPPRIIPTIEKKLHINRKTINFLNPKRSIPFLSAAVFVIYLAMLNLVLQYDKPQDEPKKAICKTEKYIVEHIYPLQTEITIDPNMR